MNPEQQEAFLAEKLKEFTDKLQEVAKEVIDDVYCDYLPHVMSDTECNVSFQVSSVIEDILAGRFTVEGGHIVVGNVRAWLANPFSEIATTIYMAAQDKIENLTIKELQTKVERLEQQLIDAYRSYYVLYENTVQD